METITIADIFGELDAYFDPGEQIQPGDITVRMLMDRYEVSETTAKRRMRKIASDGAYTMLRVGAIGMWVLRKKCDSTP